MSDEKKFGSFEEFWPHYVRAHQNPTSRKLHFVGTSLAMACVAGSVLLRKKSLLLLAPVVGYGFAWVGHFGFEKNIPATFGHPLWSLRGDFEMWKKMIEGTMDAEVEKAVAAAQAHEDPPANGARADIPFN